MNTGIGGFGGGAGWGSRRSAIMLFSMRNARGDVAPGVETAHRVDDSLRSRLAAVRVMSFGVAAATSV